MPCWAEDTALTQVARLRPPGKRENTIVGPLTRPLSRRALEERPTHTHERREKIRL